MKEIYMQCREKLCTLINVEINIVYVWELEQLKENYKITAFSKTVNWEIMSKAFQSHFTSRQLCGKLERILDDILS